MRCKQPSFNLLGYEMEGQARCHHLAEGCIVIECACGWISSLHEVAQIARFELYDHAWTSTEMSPKAASARNRWTSPSSYPRAVPR